MPVLINKLGEHRNEDAIQLLLNYMITSSFYIASNCRGCIGSSVQDVVSSFAFTKQMYDKADRKQVSHIIIGTKNEEITVEGLLVIAEAALNYFYSQGFQSFYVIHSGSNDDSGYWHIHLAVNTINFRDGKRLYETYSVTSDLKNYLALQFNELQWFSINDNSTSWEMRSVNFQ